MITDRMNMSVVETFDTIVIGSGPAGLAAAYAAGSIGRKVLVIEKMAKAGMKLLASGGSRCNVSNILDLETFAERFGRNWRFLLPALQEFHGKTLLEFFELHGVPLTLTDDFHYFPASGRASDVLQLFLKEISRQGNRIVCGRKVTGLTRERDTWLISAGDRRYRAARVVCACGGRGYPALGGSMAGYDLVSAAGHTVTPLFPAMTGVICADKRVGECAGISLPDCVAEIAVKGHKLSARGELLFTHRGFSAFAILDLAGKIAELSARYGSVPLKIDFLPDMTPADIAGEFALWRQNGGTRKVSHLLSRFLPHRIALLLLKNEDPEISRWTAASSAALGAGLKGSVFEISAVENWDKAMVTYGGVSLKEIDPHTLESRLHPGLFFAGEMMDVTGPCGGFNITWALASGMLAGRGE